MTDIETIQVYLDWREQQVQAGKPAALDDDEEHLRVRDIEDRLDQIKTIATDGQPGETPDSLLATIARLADVAR